MVRSRDSELRVIMASSVGGFDFRAEEAFRLGTVEVIGKPFGQSVIEALFERELLQKQGQEMS